LILVDSSVWIDYFNGAITVQTDTLDRLLGAQPIATGDLILAEVLQGFNNSKDFNSAKSLLTSLTVVTLGGEHIAIQAAVNFRVLRQRGITIRKTIDTFIATWCIENSCWLLHSDRDFEPFAEHLGLRVLSPPQ
jgi:predicted nucleic acid-binding protein